MALEREAAGALSEPERNHLAEHVAGCSESQRIRQLIDSLQSMPLPATSSGAIEVVRVYTARRRRRLWRTGARLTAACVRQFVFFGPKLYLFAVVLHVGAMAIEIAPFFGLGGPGGCGHA